MRAWRHDDLDGAEPARRSADRGSRSSRWTGALLLPNGNLPLNIFEPRYLQMIHDAMRPTG